MYEKRDISYIENVKDCNSHYLINDSIIVPKDENNKHYLDIQFFIESDGGILPEYTNIELQILLKDNRKKEILKQLEDIDFQSIRAIRENNIELIDKYENEAEELRAELRLL